MAHQPRQVTFGETETSEFLLQTKKKYQNSSVVGVGYDFLRNYESSERRKLRGLPAKTHALLALGRAVELRAAVEVYMSEPALVPLVAVAPELLAEQRPAAPNAAAPRVRRPAPPARPRGRSVSSARGRQVPVADVTPAAEARPARDRSKSPDIPQVEVAMTRRLFDDQDTRVLSLQREGQYGSPFSDSDEDEGEDEHDVLANSTSQAKRETTSSSSGEVIVTAQASSITGDNTSVSSRLPQHFGRALTIADPSHNALIMDANAELPLRPVPPSRSSERPRPSFPYHRC